MGRPEQCSLQSADRLDEALYIHRGCEIGSQSPKKDQDYANHSYPQNRLARCGVDHP